jgi:hypothetical protein
MTTFRFHPRLRFWFTLLAVGLVVALPVLTAAGAASRGEPVIEAALIGLLIGVLIAPIPLVFWYPKLTVSSEGLKLRGIMGPRTVTVRWDQIERLLWQDNDQALILRGPHDSLSARFFKATADSTDVKYDAAQQQFIAERRYVPFSGFSYWLVHGELYAEFRRYAPHLLDEFDAVRTSWLERQQAQTRFDRIVFVVGLIVIAIAVWFGWL